MDAFYCFKRAVSNFHEVNFMLILTWIILIYRLVEYFGPIYVQGRMERIPSVYVQLLFSKDVAFAERVSISIIHDDY